ncbi:hypothetical protein WMY93_011442 [Mugilogobius chulae]|uniref:Protein-glutamine gamma-glutamyltransferase 2 n=1 Tax=Mugilogobius chulae TaxID=88201 RepID=A0AAW0P8F1_9GOBI
MHFSAGGIFGNTGTGQYQRKDCIKAVTGQAKPGEGGVEEGGVQVLKGIDIMGVDWRPAQNNPLHHTDALSKHQLITRRGQSFSLQIQFTHPFNSLVDKLIFTAETGELPEENRGTKSVFGVPDSVERSPKALAVWTAVMEHKLSYPEMGTVVLSITPPADAPVGKYTLKLTESSGEHSELGNMVLLYNPWCTDDWVYMADENERQEYVMNQHGVIFTGSGNYINSMNWDFAQFEENMIPICLTMLDLSHKHLKDPADDVSARCNPIYVSRIVSAMINSEDDRGVLEGNWTGNFFGGVSPSHWNGSLPILKRWLQTNCHPVKFGQCWVFASVMCSVMRFLGIPCRVVTNYQSAHDSDMNLIIDVYHPDYGVRDIPSGDSVWNFHVWVEGWMRRPDLAPGFDGWQVLDPTPQRGVMVRKDGSKVQIYSDSKRVGQNISTKSLGSDKRWNITSYYKPQKEERQAFNYAITRDYTKSEEEENEDSVPTPVQDDPSPVVNGDTVSCSVNRHCEDTVDNGTSNITEANKVETKSLPAPPQVKLKFEEVSKPVNGKDVKVNLVLQSKALEPRKLSINIRVTAMSYNNTPCLSSNLSVPVEVSFSEYWQPMLDSDVMQVSTVVSDLPHRIILTWPRATWGGREAIVEVSFLNPVNETLKECTLSLSGSGLWKEEQNFRSFTGPRAHNRVRVQVGFYPYKTGVQTLVADFDCSMFRDIKNNLSVPVKDSIYSY